MTIVEATLHFLVSYVLSLVFAWVGVYICCKIKKKQMLIINKLKVVKIIVIVGLVGVLVNILTQIWLGLGKI